jgi:hypothetical protein
VFLRVLQRADGGFEVLWLGLQVSGQFIRPCSSDLAAFGGMTIACGYAYILILAPKARKLGIGIAEATV